MVGLSLALLEFLNDVGASEFLGVQTITVLIYNTWISRNNLASAAQIALITLLIVIFIISLEKYASRRRRYALNQNIKPLIPIKLNGKLAWLAILYVWLPIIIGFITPTLHLLVKTIKNFDLQSKLLINLKDKATNMLFLALSSSLVSVVCGIIVAWACRQTFLPLQFFHQVILSFARLGYAIPGTVFAIGLLACFNLFDNSFTKLGFTSIFIIGTFPALIVAYTIRFLAIATGGIELGLQRIPLSLEQASRSLGKSAIVTMRQIHLPLLKPAIAITALLVFVDSVKELSTTLLLRPINFETLATWLYGEAARGTYDEGAIAALLIVLISLIPVIILGRIKNGFIQQ